MVIIVYSYNKSFVHCNIPIEQVIDTSHSNTDCTTLRGEVCSCDPSALVFVQ